MEGPIARLRDLVEQTGVTSLGDVARQPGIMAAYRIVICRADRMTRHSVTTLRYPRLDTPLMATVYLGLFDHQPIYHAIDRARCDAFTATLQKVRFDRLADQSTFAYSSVEWWLVERAAGGFCHSVALTPDQPDLPYSAIVNAVDAYLPEALRKVMR